MKTLKNARERAGLTQKQVETTLGLRALMLKDYETGRMKLPFKTAVDLAKLYQVNLEEFIEHKEKTGESPKKKFLNRFDTVFKSTGFGVMLLDPILRGVLEDKHEKFFTYSLFELVTNDLSKKRRDHYILDLCRSLLIVASCDRKIFPEEIDSIKNILESFELKKKYSEVARCLDIGFLPSFNLEHFKSLETRHFYIWILYFFAFADSFVTDSESRYIEQCSEALRINRNNFLFIQNKFVKEID